MLRDTWIELTRCSETECWVSSGSVLLWVELFGVEGWVAGACLRR